MNEVSSNTVDGSRIVVVGGCASGKTTLVNELNRLGYQACVSAQEHSAVPSLWERSHPDLLVMLVADLPTVRARRGEHWREAVYEAQQERLAGARIAADLVIDSSTTSIAEAVELVIRTLAERRTSIR